MEDPNRATARDRPHRRELKHLNKRREKREKSPTLDGQGIDGGWCSPDGRGAACDYRESGADTAGNCAGEQRSRSLARADARSVHTRLSRSNCSRSAGWEPQEAQRRPLAPVTPVAPQEPEHPESLPTALRPSFAPLGRLGLPIAARPRPAAQPEWWPHWCWRSGRATERDPAVVSCV